MKLGLENREQVYFLAGLVVFAGYLMYMSLWRRPAPEPFHPSAPHRGSKAIGWNDADWRTGLRLPGASL